MFSSSGNTKKLSLGDEINYITASLHHELNMIIMSRLPLGLKNPKAFHEGLTSFSILYSSFESALDSHIRNPSTPSRTRAILEHVYIPAVHRAATFEADLNKYSPSSEKDELTKGTPARAYVLNHIRRATTKTPHVLLAYCHCLYMALFAGGQHIKAAIARSAVRKLDLAQHQTVPEEAKKSAPGIALFTFDGRSTKEEQELRQKLRDGIRQAEELLTPKERAEVLAESCEVFKLTRRLVDELDGICGTAPTVLVATKQYTESESPTVPSVEGQTSGRSWIKRLDRKRVETMVKGFVCVSFLVGYLMYLNVSSPSAATEGLDGNGN
ncbi:heme oxygenase [Orbilia oligospora]|uniref:Heme oxygenase n=1 Tax=Orbilia oligospora TaxID=2813651 RepID=A0A7C8PBW3_ORBOL|nr:heme oxygenase [Orbilia oligospora]